MMTDRDDVVGDVETFKRGVSRAARARGRGHSAALCAYLRKVAKPSLDKLSEHAHDLGLDLARLSEQADRHGRGPWATIHEAAEAVVERRGRLLRTLAKARASAHAKPPAGLDIEALNEERFSDPKAALESSFEALRGAGGLAEVARVLAVHANNLRERDRLDDAIQTVWVAMPLAEAAEIEERERWALIAWLHQAAACMMRVKGEGETARRLIDAAAALYCRAGSRRGRAVAMLDRAALLSSVYGDGLGAIAEASAALAMAPPDALRLVCGGYQVRAVAHHRAGDLERAAHDIEAAAAHVPAGASMLLGRVRWVQGAIASDRGALVEAETLLGEASRLIVAPVCDRLMIAAQMIQAAARRGDHRRAAEIAIEHLPRLAEPARKGGRALEAAHGDLLRAAMQAQVSVATVDRITTAIAAACPLEASRRCRYRHRGV